MINPLHDNGGGCASTITDRRAAVFAHLQLMQQGGQDPRAGAAQRVAQRDGSAEGIDDCGFKT
jgi:hypothetical protein